MAFAADGTDSSHDIAVVRQGIEHAGGNGHHAMQLVGIDALGQKVRRQDRQGDDLATGGRSGHAGNHADRDGRGQQPAAGHIGQRLDHDVEAGNGLGDGAEADHGRRVADRHQCADAARGEGTAGVAKLAPLQQPGGQAAARQGQDQGRGAQAVVPQEGHDQHDDQRQRRQAGMRQPALDQFGVVAAGLEALAARDRAADQPGQQEMAEHCHEDRHHQARLPGGQVAGAQIRNRNPVLDLRRAGRGHGEGDRTKGQGGRDEAPRQVGLTEQAQGHRIDREGDHEQADAAIGEHGAGGDHGQGGPSHAQVTDDPVADAVGGAGVLHQLAEHRAEQEHEEPVGDEAGEPAHVSTEGIRLAFGGNLGCQGEATGDCHQQGAQGAGQEQVHAAHGQHHQQDQADQQTGQAQHIVTPVAADKKRSADCPARPGRAALYQGPSACPLPAG